MDHVGVKEITVLLRSVLLCHSGVEERVLLRTVLLYRADAEEVILDKIE